MEGGKKRRRKGEGKGREGQKEGMQEQEERKRPKGARGRRGPERVFPKVSAGPQMPPVWKALKMPGLGGGCHSYY